MSNLPANITNMAKGLAASATTMANSGGSQFLKMVKGNGDFVYGQDSILIEEESRWAVNPNSFIHGWISWGDRAHGNAGTLLGEEMVPATQPLKAEEDLKDVAGDWQQQCGFQIVCINGEDEGLQCVYKASSLGFKKAYSSLIAAIIDRVSEGTEAIVPIVELKSSSYKHKQYGTIYTPVLDIVDWVTLETAVVDEEAEKEEPAKQEAEAEEKKPARRTRRSKAAAEAVTEEAETVEEAATEEADEVAPRRRRRRA